MKKILILTLMIFSINSAFAREADLNDDEFAEYEQEFDQSEQDIYDPFEKTNRKIFIFNDFLDRNIFTPIARAYGDYVPKPIRKTVRNFTTNLTLPISTINSFAQGKVDNGLATFSNFLINSTLGIGGLFNIAENKNIFYEREDFGQTLGYYGTPGGPYLMLPIIGPSTLRDASGYGFSSAIDPLGFNILKVGGSSDAIDPEIRISNTLLSAVDTREDLLKVSDDLRRDSFDLYATVRSVYIQNRNAKIRD